MERFEPPSDEQPGGYEFFLSHAQPPDNGGTRKELRKQTPLNSHFEQGSDHRQANSFLSSLWSCVGRSPYGHVPNGAASSMALVQEGFCC
jgi:hypothetical protein